MATIKIRKELVTDHGSISQLTERAFRDRPYAGGNEQDVIDRLRTEGALSLSLVALEDGLVVGQITFSPAENKDEMGSWFALGPVSVLPSRQGEGIGSMLINEGLRQIEESGALGCILTGNQQYYKKFGFEPSPKNCPSGEPMEYFQLNCFKGPKPTGRFSFHQAFYD